MPAIHCLRPHPPADPPAAPPSRASTHVLMMMKSLFTVLLLSAASMSVGALQFGITHHGVARAKAIRTHAPPYACASDDGGQQRKATIPENTVEVGEAAAEIMKSYLNGDAVDVDAKDRVAAVTPKEVVEEEAKRAWLARHEAMIKAADEARAAAKAKAQAEAVTSFKDVDMGTTIEDKAREKARRAWLARREAAKRTAQMAREMAEAQAATTAAKVQSDVGGVADAKVQAEAQEVAAVIAEVRVKAAKAEAAMSTRQATAVGTTEEEAGAGAAGAEAAGAEEAEVEAGVGVDTGGVLPLAISEERVQAVVAAVGESVSAGAHAIESGMAEVSQAIAMSVAEAVTAERERRAAQAKAELAVLRAERDRIVARAHNDFDTLIQSLVGAPAWLVEGVTALPSTLQVHAASAVEAGLQSVETATSQIQHAAKESAASAREEVRLAPARLSRAAADSVDHAKEAAMSSVQEMRAEVERTPERLRRGAAEVIAEAKARARARLARARRRLVDAPRELEGRLAVLPGQLQAAVTGALHAQVHLAVTRLEATRRERDRVRRELADNHKGRSGSGSGQATTEAVADESQPWWQKVLTRGA